MNYFKCDCGSTLFFQVIPQVFEYNNVRVWGANQLMLSENNSIALLYCLECSKLHLPSVSIIGKNALDKEVQVYKSLIGVVQNHNNRINNRKAAYDWTIKLLTRVKKLEEEIDKLYLENITFNNLIAKLEEKSVEPLDNEDKEVVRVKTSKRSKKDTSDTV